MNALRVEAYLRSACSVLNFDVGELWTVRENPGQAPSLHFMQLYTSPLYEDFHNILIRPSHIQEGVNDDQEHRFSPIICRGVSDGGQIVWANTKLSDGLIGRNDLPLNTAVGVPICSVGMDLCILILFSVDSVPMTTNAIDFLSNIVSAASGSTGISGFLPSSISSIVTFANTEQFVGVWDMIDLLVKYSKEVDFHVLPVKRLQEFFDFQEHYALIQLFDEFRETRDGRFDPRQLLPLQKEKQIRQKEKDRIQENISSDLAGTAACAMIGGSSIPRISSCDSISSSQGAFTFTTTTNEEEVSDISTHSLSPTDSPKFSSSSSSSSTDGPTTTTSSNTMTSKDNNFAVNDFKTTQNSITLDILHSCGIGAFSVNVVENDLTSTNSPNDDGNNKYSNITGNIINTTSTMLAASSKNNLKKLQNILHGCSSSDAGAGAATPGTIIPKLLPSDNAASMNNNGFIGPQTDARKESKDPSSSSSSSSQNGQQHTVCSLHESMIDGRMGYRKNAERFHEFMVAMIGMTIFEAVELWLYSEIKSDLYVACAVHDRGLRPFTDESKHIRLNMNQDMAGHCMYNSCTFWDSKYNEHDDDELFPRCVLSKDLGIVTALGVPLPGPSGACGVLVLYSREKMEVEPLMVTFIERGVQLLSASTLHSKALAHFDIESWANAPRGLIQDWVDEKTKGQSLTSSCDVKNSNNSSGLIVPPRLSSTKVHVKTMNQYSDETSSHFPACVLYRKKRGLEMESLSSSNHNNLNNQSSASCDGTDRSFHTNLLPKAPRRNNDNRSQYEVQDEMLMCSEIDHSTICNKPDCNEPITMNSQFCTIHTNSRRCIFEGCTKCAQGKTSYCISHGGGRRCTVEGCFKAARDKLFCAGHGGGKRCSLQDCSKAAVGGSGFCTRHGGGKRCQHPGCTKSSQASTNFCVRHGGGRKCCEPNCNKAARSRTDFCASHGNGANKKEE